LILRKYQCSSSRCAALKAREVATDADLVRSENEIFDDV